MLEIPFIKMHGLGNNYIYIDQRIPFQLPPYPELAITLSDQNRGIGSDGLIVILPSMVATAKMRIFNRDGSEGKNCGNGLRCVAKYLYEKGEVPNHTLSIETLSGVVQATVSAYQGREAIISVDMGPPILERKAIPMHGDNSPHVISEPFMIDQNSLLLTAVSMGNPHAVFFTENLHHTLHQTLGPKIEKDSRFPEQVNVEFVTVKSSTSLQCRVWERGSGLTQACGTGACASVVAAILNGYCLKDCAITVHLDGGDLTVYWNSNGTLHLSGPAVTIAKGLFVY